MGITHQDPYVSVESKPVYHFADTSYLEQFPWNSSLLVRFWVSDKTFENAKLLNYYKTNQQRSLRVSGK